MVYQDGEEGSVLCHSIKKNKIDIDTRVDHMTLAGTCSFRLQPLSYLANVIPVPLNRLLMNAYMKDCMTRWGARRPSILSTGEANSCWPGRRVAVAAWLIFRTMSPDGWSPAAAPTIPTITVLHNSKLHRFYHTECPITCQGTQMLFIKNIKNSIKTVGSTTVHVNKRHFKNNLEINWQRKGRRSGKLRRGPSVPLPASGKGNKDRKE